MGLRAIALALLAAMVLPLLSAMGT